MSEKKHIYFKEEVNELRLMPIEEINCYYLGCFTQRQIGKINKYLSDNGVSFLYLSELVYAQRRFL